MAIKAKKRTKNTHTRACGPCTVCCGVIPVPELEKQARAVCGHSGASGCDMYRRRPRTCRLFKCMWLKGAFKENARPDLIGGVFFTEGAHGCTAHETEDGQMHPRAFEIVDSFLALGAEVHVVDPKGRARAFATDVNPMKVMVGDGRVNRALNQYRKERDERA